MKQFSPTLIIAALMLCLSSVSGNQATFVAEEWTRYVKLMTGGKEPVGAVTFEVDSAIADDGEAFTIAPDGDRIKVTGSSQYMVLSAAYHLLDRLGCHFLAPHFDHYRGSAEVVPQVKDLAIRIDAPIIRRPAMEFRKLYVEEGHSHNIENLQQLVDWMPKAGYNTLVIPTDYAGSGRVKWDHWRDALTPELQKRGITIEVGGHGYENFMNAAMQDGKLFAEHPEWFGLDQNGARSRSKKRVFCTSNSQAVDFVANNVLTYLKDRPEIQIFDFWPPDGAQWCACDDCAKLGEPPDRQAILLRQVQEKLTPVRPDVRLEVIAYSSYLQPPTTQRIDANVLVDFCPISQHFDAPIFDPENKNRHYADALLAWRAKFGGDISIYSYYRKYAWDSLPVIIPLYMRDDLRWYAKVPVQGVSVYSEPGDWFTYELNHYVLGRLAWDPNQEVLPLVYAFCKARYGKDHYATAVAALDALSQNVRVCGSIPHTPLKTAARIERAVDDVRQAIDGIDHAAGKMRGSRHQHAFRRLKLMCIYALRDLEIQRLRADGAPVDQILPKIEALHGFLEDHAADGVFLMRGGRLSVSRMISRYGLK